MPHAIWTGAISFGLVTIPVTLHGAEKRRELAFHLLDRRDLAPIKQVRTNAVTGEEVPWEEVVKGFELEKGSWVIVTDDDFRAANVSRHPDHRHRRLRLRRADRRRVLRQALLARAGESRARRPTRCCARRSRAPAGSAWRTSSSARASTWPLLVPAATRSCSRSCASRTSSRPPTTSTCPRAATKDLGVTEAELAMAGTLVDSMAAEWDPAAYPDTYHDDLLALIERKAETGEVAAPPPPPEAGQGAEVVDIMDLLKRSVERGLQGRRGLGGTRGAARGVPREARLRAHARAGRRRVRGRRAGASSSRSTRRARSTTTSGSSSRACCCRGPCRRARRSTRQTSGSRCTSRTTRSTTPTSRARSRRASTAAAP